MSADLAQERFGNVVTSGAIAGLLAHLLFLGAFVAIGAKVLAAFNVGSVILFTACIQLARRGLARLATTFILVEVLAHAALASWILGWSSGFHYYVFCLIPLAIAVPHGGTGSRILFLAFCAGLYLALDYSAHAIGPLRMLDQRILDGFRAFNILGSLAILGVLVVTLRGAIAQAESRLTDIANTDLLSGLFTRRHGLHLIHREIQRATQCRTPLSFALADVDGFKEVNDRHGHEIGDHIVAAVGQRLRAGVRQGDSVARWGGDEFLMILPGLDGPSARATVERVKQSVSSDPVRVDDLEIVVGMTFGVTEYSPGETIEDCVRAADAALYDGKRMGANRVVLATPMRPNAGTSQSDQQAD